MIENRVIMVSFSGGLTSAFMSRFMQKHYEGTDQKLIYLFANTGMENEETLRFIDDCDHIWNLGVVWIEPVVHFGERKSSTHKIVDFNSATRGPLLFFRMIKKYGLPNKSFPHCTRELKQRPMKSYMRSVAKDWTTAIGIRKDEEHRARSGEAKNPIYPLVDMGITKEFIAKWWSEQPFGLRLKSYQGNCDLCWKKSLRKRLTILKEAPEKATNWIMLEKQAKGKYFFDRDNHSVLDLSRMARDQDITPPDDDYEYDPVMDEEKPCFCGVV